MTELYEAHITYEIEHREAVEKHRSDKWKFSAIDGDPILGKKVFCYLTSYDSSATRLLERMQEEVSRIGVKEVRQKIEKIVYDTKTSRNEVGFPPLMPETWP
jgi:hypothetical protein